MMQSTTRDFFLAAIFFAAAFLALSGVAPIGTSSEAREAHVVQTIVTDGEWILPTRNGLLPSKPPLHHWLAALFGIVTGAGSSELVARAPSALSAAGVLWLTAMLGAMLAYSREDMSRHRTQARTIGFLAMLIVGTTYGFTYMATDARVDMLCTLCIVAAVFMIARRLQEGLAVPRPLLHRVRQEDLFWFYFWCGLGVLAKGPLGVVLPVIVVSALCISTCGVRETIAMWIRPAWGWGVFLCLALPWYVAGWLLTASSGGEDLVSRNLVFENVTRFFGGDSVNHESSLFYIGSFARVAAPWSVIFILILLRGKPAADKRFPGFESSEIRSQRLRSGFMWAFVFGFLFFSAASGKRHSYLLPIFPFLSVFLAGALYQWFSTRRDVVRAHVRSLRRAMLWAFAVVLMLCLGMLLSIWLLSPDVQVLFPLDEHAEQRSLLAHLVLGSAVAPLSALALLALGMVLAQLTHESIGEQQAAFVRVSVLLFALSITLGNTVKNGLKSFPELAAQVRVLAGTDRVTVVRAKSDELFDPILYYLGQKVIIVPPDPLTLPCDSRSTILARTSFFEDFMRAGLKGRRLQAMFTLRSRVDALLGRDGPGMVAFRCESTGERSHENPVRVEQSREIVGA